MDTLIVALKLVSIVAFASYGLACVLTERMVAEFERYRVPQLRLLTGWLEVAGAIGLAIGFVSPWFDLLASSGLTLLMIGAVTTRVRIRDTFVQSAPAISLLVICGILATSALQRIN